MEQLLKMVENFRKFGKIILKELSTNIMLSKTKNVQFLSELFYIKIMRVIFVTVADRKFHCLSSFMKILEMLR